MRLADPEAALHDAAAALAQFEALGDEAGTEAALSTFGVIALDQGRFKDALESFLAAFRLCRGRGDRREAIALYNLGAVHDYLGDYAAALDYHLRSWRVSQKGDNALGEKFALNNIGYMYYRLGQHQEALTHYGQALSFEGVGDRQLHALLLDNIGLAYEKLGDYAKALDYQHKSLAIREATGDRWGVGDSLAGLGSVYMALGKTAEARQQLERSLTLKEAVKNQKGQAETCILLGILLTREGQLEPALGYLQRARETAAAIASREVLAKAHDALAETYKQSGHFQEALTHYENYHQLRDDLHSELTNGRLHSLRVRFEVEQVEREKELYRLKNAELAGANRKLELLTASLRKADQEKSDLLVQLERQANEDSLTGLHNRRYFDARLTQAFDQARRLGKPLSVVLCDLDDFKEINDRFSHLLGDRVLVTVSALFRDHLKSAHTVARYGGEEFVFLLSQTTAAGAAVIGEKLRHAVAVFPWHTLAAELSVTASLGVSDDLTVDRHHLLRSADLKLYGAKHRGKNQVRR